MSNVTFEYSLIFEVNRVTYCFKKAEWFKEKGYHLDLPKNLNTLDFKTVDSKKIKEAIRDEFKESDYEEKVINLKERWEDEGDEFIKKVKKINLEPQFEYKVIFTRYGTGGSYHPPDQVVINIRGKSDSDLWKVMIHETVHLLLHQYIIKYEVSHWKKERIVDLLVQKFFPNSTELQNVPIETDTIDLLFRDNFPKIEEVIKKLD